MDTNLNVERCKVQEFNANNRFIYVTGGASVTESLKLGSLNLLGNEVLTNSQDCFYFQDYFSYNNAKKFSLICKDSPRTSVFDQTQYNQSNSKYFIRFRNITSTNFDQFASIIVRNNIFHYIR
jgi:hypothetical protein